MGLKLIICKIKYHYFPYLLKNEEFIYMLEQCGISVGKGTIFYNPQTIQIDRSRTYLLTIGEYCKITSGVTILTHDYSRSVLRRVYGEIIGEGKKTYIGNNVFIGMNSIILMGSHIGDNVIVGAGSVVHGKFPNNVVIAGNPAKIICTLDAFYQKRCKEQFHDAVECINTFIEKYKRKPNIKEVDPFWQLFLERSEEAIQKNGVNIELNGDNVEDVIKNFLNTKKSFNSFEDFLNFCILNKSKN